MQQKGLAMANPFLYIYSRTKIDLVCLYCSLHDVCSFLCSVTHLYLTHNSFGKITEGKACHSAIVKCYRTTIIASFADALNYGNLS